MPTNPIPIFPRDENDTPLNGLNLYVDGVFQQVINSGDTFEFPCGEDIDIVLENPDGLWYQATGTENMASFSPTITDIAGPQWTDDESKVGPNCNNVVGPECQSSALSVGNNPLGAGQDPACYTPVDRTPPAPPLDTEYNVNLVTANNGIINYAFNYGPVTVSYFVILQDIVDAINADTAVHKYQATLVGTTITLTQTSYLPLDPNSDNLNVFVQQYIGVNVTDDAYDSCNLPAWTNYQVNFHYTYRVYNHILEVDGANPIPFYFQNSLYIPCCSNWDNDGNPTFDPADELYPMHIVLASPSYDGCISEFYIVRYPCSNQVCVYDMTNIPYCKYIYDFDYARNPGDITRFGRNVCYTYHCFDNHTIRQTVTRCEEQFVPETPDCGCRDSWVQVPTCVASSTQDVPVFDWVPDVSISYDREADCLQECIDCNNGSCNDVCIQERVTINYTVTNDYVCCNTDPINPSGVEINLLINGVVVATQTDYGSYQYEWSPEDAGKNIIKVEVTTCCGVCHEETYLNVQECKPHDLAISWDLACDCKNQYIEENCNKADVDNVCNCLPEDTEIIFTPDYTFPECGCWSPTANHPDRRIRYLLDGTPIVTDDTDPDGWIYVDNGEVVDDRLFYTFCQGCYLLELEVENCSGSCVKGYNICVGERVVVKKDSCYHWHISDCGRYECIPEEVVLPFGEYIDSSVINSGGGTWTYNGYVYYVLQEVPSCFIPCEPDLNLEALYPQYFKVYALAGGTELVCTECEEHSYLDCVQQKYKAVIEIKDINGNLIDKVEILDYLGGNTDFELAEDGVYYVYASIYMFNTQTQVYDLIHSVSYGIVEYCGLYACYEKMLQSIQCIDDCECKDKVEEQQKMYDFNRFMAFWQQLNYAINLEYSVYSIVNETVLSEKHKDNLNTIDKLMKDLQKLCNKCGCDCVNKTYSCPKRVNFPAKSSCGCR